MADIQDIEFQGQREQTPQEGTPRREIPLDQRRQMRHDSRVSQTWKKFLKLLEANGLSKDRAEKAAVAVLCTLEQRLIGNEPDHLEAQLPFKLKEMLHRCELHESGHHLQKLDREAFSRMVADHLGDQAIEIEPTIRAVFGAVRDLISQGEVDDVVGQLPSDLAELWRPAV